MSLSIVIVNYNSEELLKNCLDSIFRSTLKDIEVIVVDNSPNHSRLITALSQYPQIKQINSDFNSGFGRANNLGAKIADKDFLLFLNPDIILNIDTLEICLSEFKLNKKAGILACQLKFENYEIQESRSYNIFNLNSVLIKSSLYTKYFKRKIIKGPIESLTGCFLLTSKDIFNNVNGFDPDFCMYSEEFDLKMESLQNMFNSKILSIKEFNLRKNEIIEYYKNLNKLDLEKEKKKKQLKVLDEALKNKTISEEEYLKKIDWFDLK